MYKLIYTFFISLIFYVSLATANTGKDSILVYYEKSKAVFTGIVTNIYEIKNTTLNENNLIVEFQLTEIYKGKRREKMITVNDKSIIQNVKVSEEYLVYTEKNNINDKFFITRILNVKENTTIEEIRTLYKYLKSKLFKRVKSPQPLYKFIQGEGCGC